MFLSFKALSQHAEAPRPKTLKDEEPHIKSFRNWLIAMQLFFKRLAFFTQYYFKKFLFKYKLRLPKLKKAHVNAFPSVPLKKVDGLDLFLKFSSEILVVGLVLLVGILNVVFFKFSKAFNDNSQAFQLLSYHPQLNTKYYGKETSISTVMINGNGLIAQASAEDFQGLTNQPTTVDENGNAPIVSDNYLVNPNPDSIKAMVAKQIKIYTTQQGDTLQSVAAANGITVQTLIDANKLTSTTILKPGWQLVILPTDGVLYTANSNDTLPDVAKKFSGNLDTIVAYNGLADAEDITDGQLIIIPGGHMPLPPAPKPTPKPRTDSSKIGGSGPVDNVQNDTGSGWDEASHLFPKGYCTWYVAQKVHIPWGGNAKEWIANSKAYGAVVDKDPARGTIMVTSESRKYGHVAYVESVNGDGTITVSEMNFEHFGRVDYRTLSIDSPVIRGFIHP